MRYKDTKKISKKQIFREIFGAHPQKRVLVVPPRGRLPCYASAMHGRLKRKQQNFLRKERKDNEHGNTRKTRRWMRELYGSRGLNGGRWTESP